MDVPVSLSAFSQERMDAQNIVSVDDVARISPGVTFRRADQRDGMASSISIRGIASTAGAATTGIYIDDTPIQARSLGYSSFSTYPQVFDLQRVEVLRGPQGTLFGAGSQGGTIRFITPPPSLDRASGYVRSELSSVQDGGTNYEIGAAYGAPIIEERLGFRVSAWRREDGGYVDRVNWDRDTLEATGVLDRNSNSMTSTVLRGALTFAPTEDVTITPAVYYQNLKLDDTIAFWEDLSRRGAGDYYNGNAQAAPSRDRFVLPSLELKWHLGSTTLTSNTSYFKRENEAVNDYTAFEFGIWAGNPYFPEGVFASAYQYNEQKNWTQEFRLEGVAGGGRLNWVSGVFYWDAEQTARQLVENVFLPDMIPLELIFGQGLADGRYTFAADPIRSEDQEIAVFGQLDYDLTDNLTLTAGLRYSRTKIEASADYRGPVVGPVVSDSGSQRESPLNPKLGLSYSFNEDHMVYASAARGFRIGGYNPRVGAPCAGALSNLGLTEAPPLYESDSVWSYEVGAKNTLADGRVTVSSSAYHVDWNNIQQSVALAACGFLFVSNLGSATSRGMDVQLDVAATDNLVLNLALGYTNAKFDESVQGGPDAVNNLVSRGDHIVSPPWTAALSAEYGFNVMQRDAYARFDYQYQARQSDRVPAQNPANGPVNNPFMLPETHLLGGRIGMRWSGIDLAIFGTNLLNSTTVLSQAVTPGAGSLRQHSTFRPRTVGVSMNYRY